MKLLAGFALCFALLACSRGSAIQISDNTGDSAIRLSGNNLYINSGLLGLPENTGISVDTSSGNEISFDVKGGEPRGMERRGGAF